MQEEIQSPQIVNAVALDAASAKVSKVVLHSLGGKKLTEPRVNFLGAGDDPDVAGITFISRSSVA